MIIIRYLIYETLKNQVTILFILFFIFFCQKLVRVLDATADGIVSKNLIVPLLILGMPEMAQLIFPLSLFLSLLITLSYMYAKNEIIAMYACGFSKIELLRSALLLSLITIVLEGINVMWISPWSCQYQDIVMSESKADIGVSAIMEGRFKSMQNGNSVLFIEQITNNNFNHIFLAQLRKIEDTYPFIVIADHGYLNYRSDGSQVFVLKQGTFYEKKNPFLIFRITDFDQTKIVIHQQKKTLLFKQNINQLTLLQLWNSKESKKRAELHWRFTLIVSIPIMAIIAIPFSMVNSRRKQFFSLFFAMLLYLFFFLLQTSLRANSIMGKLDPKLWSWITNIAYLFLALFLNLLDNSFFVKRICNHFRIRK
ncbi:LPS export ABC transporter permease LptF [Sodalis sp. CWE]|uniref:LPS export ABC transporter permease LptF n=1 Tax=Sodalis sp. CWE TaxID=2803816 RepID=UPI001C7DBBF6|nr:LPS export ABC transporter permease LptF [Sodalis sp. CWE]